MGCFYLRRITCDLNSNHYILTRPSEKEQCYLRLLTGTVVINGVESTNPENVIAAFVDNECRGVDTTIESQGNQFFFLMIRSNTNNETVTFKLYDAQIDSVLNVSNTVIFSVNEGIGTVDNPFEFIANYYVNSTACTHPNSYTILTSYPNPFNNSTNIHFSLLNETRVTLSIFDMGGKKVTELIKIAWAYSLFSRRSRVHPTSHVGEIGEDTRIPTAKPLPP